MFNRLWGKAKVVFDAFNVASQHLKNQYAYEIRSVSSCPKTSQHLLEIKLVGRGQSIYYLAEEIAVDSTFLKGFAPADIRTIIYLASSDRYEALLVEEKIKKPYQLVRSKNKNGKKAIQLKNKDTGEYINVSLKDFGDSDLIDKLDSQDAYFLGYLAGQEQTLKDCTRLKLLVNNKSDPALPSNE